MNKILLIIQREFLSRVKKKTFVIMTILGPILFAGLMIAPALLASLPEGPKRILVLDQAYILDFEKGTNEYKFDYLPPKELDFDAAKKVFEESDHDAFLFIPLSESGALDYIQRNSQLIAKKNVSLSMDGFISKRIEKNISNQLLLDLGVNPEVVAQVKPNVSLKKFSLGDDDNEGKVEESNTEIKMAIGFATGFLIYFFIFLYSSQVMRGVIEEKSNRIVEVIISSVRPFQLMMGKIIGIGSVGILQFLIWVFLSFGLYGVASTYFLKDKMDTTTIMEAQQNMPNGGDVPQLLQIQESVSNINFPLVLTAFLIFFLGGYFLYGSLFAAVGSAVDNETDTQQFMLPITLPLILGIVLATNVIENPDGPIAFWFSMIPLTSPIVMMIRIPFGVPMWELALSIALLVGGFILTTWMAGKIYRTGILMYGKKVSYKELYKWLKYKG